MGAKALKAEAPNKIKGIMPNHKATMPPVKLLVNLYAPAGERLAKKPEKPSSYVEIDYTRPRYDPDAARWWQKALPPRQDGFSRQERGALREPMGRVTADGLVIFPEKNKANWPGGNLPKHAYQFWIGSSLVESKTAVCRVCGKFTWGPQERKDHFDFAGCSKVMVRAIKSFMGKSLRMCACGCTRDHRLELWGLGFYSLECIADFAFYQGKISPRLREIIDEEKIRLVLP